MTGKKRAVIQKDLTGNVIAEHESIAAAGRAVGCGRYAIQEVCDGIAKTAKGYAWEYADEKCS